MGPGFKSPNPQQRLGWSRVKSRTAQAALPQAALQGPGSEAPANAPEVADVGSSDPVGQAPADPGAKAQTDSVAVAKVAADLYRPFSLVVEGLPGVSPAEDLTPDREGVCVSFDLSLRLEDDLRDPSVGALPPGSSPRSWDLVAEALSLDQHLIRLEFNLADLLDHQQIVARLLETSDNDGILDTIEDNTNPNRDTDGDGVPYHFDRDSDGDGNPDTREGHPLILAHDANLDGEVEDAGGVGTNGFLDVLETVADNGVAVYNFDGGLAGTVVNTDRAQNPDFQDLDSDDDGIADTDEVANATDADNDAILDANTTDADGDGLPDSVDRDHDGPNSTINADPGAGTSVTLTNSDGDATPDVTDLDSDNDGVPDMWESGVPNVVDSNFDGYLDGADTDNDGLRDVVDGDDANFGSPGTALPDPVDTGGGMAGADFRVLDSDGGPLDRLDYGLPSGAGSIDADGNGRIDSVADADGDGVVDTADRKSIGPGTFFGFPEMVDPDNDGISNKIDIDDDNDGLRDVDEDGGNVNRDSDGDGIVDRMDLDSDGDGIPDVTEGGLSVAVQAANDTDGDGDLDTPVGANGLADAVELTPGNLNYTISDRDSLGRPDFQDRDTDSDGITDTVEASGTDVNGDGVQDGAQTDSDRDGLIDTLDRSHDGPNSTVAANPGAGTPLTVPDTDGDTIRDWRDLDSDNDGLTDVTEAVGTDANGDGILDGAGTDGDGDGLADSVDGAPRATPSRLRPDPSRRVSPSPPPESCPGFRTRKAPMGSSLKSLTPEEPSPRAPSA